MFGQPILGHTTAEYSRKVCAEGNKSPSWISLNFSSTMAISEEQQFRKN